MYMDTFLSGTLRGIQYFVEADLISQPCEDASPIQLTLFSLHLSLIKALGEEIIAVTQGYNFPLPLV